MGSWMEAVGEGTCRTLSHLFPWSWTLPEAEMSPSAQTSLDVSLDPVWPLQLCLDSGVSVTI